MTHRLWIVTNHLSDMSKTYDVMWNDTQIPCVTAQDAYALLTKLSEALDLHSVDLVELV